MSEVEENRVSAEIYARAESFLPWNAYFMAQGAQVQPNWIGTSNRFWYIELTPTGHSFLLVDADAGEVRPAFDHARLAESLSKVMGVRFEPAQLPFATFQFTQNEQFILVEIAGNKLKCDLASYSLATITTGESIKAGELLSPDGRTVAFIKNENIFIKNLAGDQATPLTTDGTRLYVYGATPECSTTEISQRLLGKTHMPLAIWSPDSTKLFTFRLDERQVRECALVQYALQDSGQSPKIHSYRTAFPGDENVAQAQLYIFDIKSGSIIQANCPSQPVTFQSPVESKRIWWNADSRYIYYIYTSRGDKSLSFYEINAQTGESRLLVEETSQTWISTNLEGWKAPNVIVLKESNEFIWFSERDGWAHLYLYQKDGLLKHQITSGEWVVRELLWVDEKNRWVYFTAAGREPGRDPYHRHLYRIGLDGSNLTLLTPEDADHDLRVFPSQLFLLDSFSRADSKPLTVVRDLTGNIICKVAEGNLDMLFQFGWKFPEPFKVKASDGLTDLHGLIYKPTWFNPAQSYPVIASVYPGPQTIRTSKHFPNSPDDALRYWEGQAVSELGFIVVVMDGRGTPLRSKAMNDFAFGNLDYAGNLADLVAGLRQLSQERPYMDLDHVGVFGHSAGGAESVQALLTYPDFFKVGFASAGPYDLRGYLAYWGERFQGLPDGNNYASQVTGSKAGNLVGKLMLAHGEMDDNVPLALTLQLAAALIQAGKDFDLLLIPNRNHATLLIDAYYHRRMWDFFVTNLASKIPPVNYQIQPINPALLAALLES